MPKKRVSYVPPDDTEVEKYARVVCKKFSEDDSALAEVKNVSEFANFLKMLVGLKVKQSNAKHNPENDNEVK